MQQVQLQTNDGHDVVRVWVPPFVVLPEVIQWGDRTFVLSPYSRADASLRAVYVEGLCFCVPAEYAVADGEELHKQEDAPDTGGPLR